MGETKTTKLLARKCPNPFPVYDAVIKNAHSLGLRWWETIAKFFEGQSNIDRRHGIREQVGATAVLSPPRTLDVTIWIRHGDRGWADLVEDGLPLAILAVAISVRPSRPRELPLLGDWQDIPMSLTVTCTSGVPVHG